MLKGLVIVVVVTGIFLVVGAPSQIAQAIFP